MNRPVDIAVVVVGINSRDYVKACLSSLERAEWGDYTHAVVYVDNGSADGSVAMVRTEFPSTIILGNTHNAGFCAACNQGVASISSRYVYLLNNDTVVLPESVRLLAECLDRRPKTSAAANRLLNPDYTEQWSARRFPTGLNGLFGRRSMLTRVFRSSATVRHYLYIDEWAGSKPFDVDWVPGSCTMVRRDAYEEVGGLPEDMHYWSDAVFCDRLRKKGWGICVVPAARLIHHEGKGTGQKSSSMRRWLIADFHDGAYRLYCEHYALGRWHPARWLARTALGVRARVLIAADSLNRLRQADSQGVQSR